MIHLLEDVGGEKDRLGLAHAADEVADLVFLIRIEAVGGLVEDEHLGIVDDRLRETGAVAIPFREGVDALVADRFEEGGLDRPVDRGLDFRGRNTAHLRGEPEEGLDRHVGVKRSGLGEIADLRLGLDLVFLNVGAADADAPPRRGEVSGDHSHRGRFAGTVGAEKSEDFSLLDGKGDPVDRHLGTEVFVEIFDFYHD
jgi:hypothetical protein